MTTDELTPPYDRSLHTVDGQSLFLVSPPLEPRPRRRRWRHDPRTEANPSPIQRGADADRAVEIAPGGRADRVLYGLTLLWIVLTALLIRSLRATFLWRRAPLAALADLGVMVVVGLFVLGVLARTSYRHYRMLAKPLLLVAAVLLLAGSAVSSSGAGGAPGWMTFASFRSMPGELAKLAMVLWLAASLGERMDGVQHFWTGYLPRLLVACVFSFLCISLPAFGSALTIWMMIHIVMFAAGARGRHVLASVVASVSFTGVILWSTPYRSRRIVAWLDHATDASVHSLRDGLGFDLSHLVGNVRHSFPVGSESGSGLLISGALMLTRGLIAWRGLRISMRSADPFALCLSLTLAVFFGLQGLGHLTDWLELSSPNSGIGKWPLLANCTALGVLLSVSRAARSR